MYTLEVCFTPNYHGDNLCSEHQALAREIEEHATSHTSVSTEGLEAQLEQVVRQLEAKAEQINTHVFILAI